MAIPVDHCRICRSKSLEPILSLGDMPPVNSFLSGQAEIAKEKKHPLALALCLTCTHLQLTHMLDPKDIFSDYIYFSSMSETVVRWGKQLADRYQTELGLSEKDLVGELASNDGCILKPFKAFCRIQGVEPAKNIAEVANKDGVPTHADFFNLQTGKLMRAQHGPAKLIIARNVVAHVPEVVDFVAGANHWLADDGIFHIEVPYVGEMVSHLEFDTIYHEHLSYFSGHALERLFKEAGMVFWDVEKIALHGGSLIARGKRSGTPTGRVAALLAEETRANLHQVQGYQSFADGTRKLKDALPAFLTELKKGGKNVAGYGAAAKGVVLTNYCGIDGKLVDWVADKSQYKQGKLMPGMHLPVVHPDEVAKQKPDHLIVFAWNFFEEISKQLAPYGKSHGKFVLPVPQPRVVS